MLSYKEYRAIREKYFGDELKAHYKYYFEYRPAMEKKMDCDKVWIDDCVPCKKECFEFAPLPKAVPVPGWDLDVPYPVDCIKKEGKTPMRYNDNYAVATVTTTQSDAATQRAYLLDRLARADYPKRKELETLFNLYVDNSPKTYKDLIDAIKNDKFTLDTKRTARIDAAVSDEESFCCIHPFDGIIWGGPQPDLKSFETANVEKGKQYTAAKDVIMTGDAVAGLAALQAFEAWMPTPATATVQ